MKQRARLSVYSGSHFMGDIDLIGRPARTSGGWLALAGFIFGATVALLGMVVLVQLLF